MSHTPAGSANKLLDALIDKIGLKNDAALARALSVSPPVISKLRHATLPIGGTLLVAVHEASGMSIREMKELAGLRSIPSLSCRVR